MRRKSSALGSENLLTSAMGGGAPSASLAYDPAQRLYQVTGAATTRFAYDGLNAIAEYDGSGNVLHRYVYDPTSGQPVMEYNSNGYGSTFHRFYGTDERGSILSVTDINGAVIGINTYDEYGKPAASNTGRLHLQWLRASASTTNRLGTHARSARGAPALRGSWSRPGGLRAGRARWARR